MVLDTLEILITGDATALESVTKKAISSLLDMTKQIGSMTIDWSAMFATIGPTAAMALGGAIAAGMAASIQNMATTATANTQSNVNPNSLGGTLSGSTQESTTAAIALGDATLTSAGDIQDAMSIASKNFSDNQGIMDDLTKTAATLSAEGYGSITDIVAQLSDTLKAWNVNTAADAETALDGIFKASKNTTLGFSDFVNMIQSGGSALSSSTTITDTANSIAKISKQAGITKADVSNMFGAIASAAADPLSQTNLLLGSEGKILSDINSGGVIGAFNDIANKMKSGPLDTAVLLGGKMGLTATSVDDLRKTTATDMLAMEASIQAVIDKTGNLQSSLNTMKQQNPFAGWGALIQNTLLAAFNNIPSMFSDIFSDRILGNNIVTAMTNIFDGTAMKNALKDFAGSSLGGALTAIGSQLIGGDSAFLPNTTNSTTNNSTTNMVVQANLQANSPTQASNSLNKLAKSAQSK